MTATNSNVQIGCTCSGYRSNECPIHGEDDFDRADTSGPGTELTIREADVPALMGQPAELVRRPNQRSSAFDHTFVNIDEALKIDKVKSQRGEAREMMCIRDQVLVIICEREEFYEGTQLFVPDKFREKQSEGIVIAVGPGRVDVNNVWVPTVVRRGDRVIFGRYSGREFKLQGREVRMLREDDLESIIR